MRTATEPDLENLEMLFDELMKNQPEESVIKERMHRSGLPYTKDPIERIQYVLSALQFREGGDAKETSYE